MAENRKRKRHLAAMPKVLITVVNSLGVVARNGAGDRTRTYDPIITNDVLYQLSYSGTGSERPDVRGALALVESDGKIYFLSSANGSVPSVSSASGVSVNSGSDGSASTICAWGMSVSVNLSSRLPTIKGSI